MNNLTTMLKFEGHSLPCLLGRWDCPCSRHDSGLSAADKQSRSPATDKVVVRRRKGRARARATGVPGGGLEPLCMRVGGGRPEQEYVCMYAEVCVEFRRMS